MKLDQVISNHINSIGGYEVVEGLKSMLIDFHLVEPTFEVDGTYAANRQGQMRVDIFANQVRVFAEGYDGSQGWQLPQDAESGIPTSPAGTKALIHGIENQLFGLHEFESRGHKLELEGQDIVDEIEYFVIKIVYADGDKLWRYVNSKSWLIDRNRERKALHPDVDAGKVIIETQFTDFRKVRGLYRSFQEVQVDLSTRQVLQTTKIKKMKINPVFKPNYFQCP